MNFQPDETDGSSPPIAAAQANISPYKLHTNPFRGVKYGVGLQIMKKMGYIEGHGLGIHGQGITEPIETKVRKFGQGIGAGLDLEDNKFHNEQDEGESSDEEYYKETPKKSLFQIIHELEGSGVQVPQSLKHMSDELSQRPISLVKDDNVEVISQLNLLNEKIIDIRANIKMIEYEELEQEKEFRSLSKQLTDCVELRKKLDLIKLEGDTPLEAIQNYRLHIQQLDIKMNPDTQRSLVSAIQPTIVKLFNKWDPWNIHDFSLLEELILWSDIFPPLCFDGLDYYQSLIASQWHSKISTAFKEWEINAPNWATTILLDWEQVIPKEMMSYFLSQIVIPRLIMGIQEWDGMGDGPNIWIFEWLPYLNRYADTLTQEFVKKYDLLLQEKDDIVGLAAYKELIGDVRFEKSLELRVLPRLVTLVQNYQFNFDSPDTLIVQRLDYWKEWFHSRVFQTFIQQALCNAWLRALYHTLNKGSGFSIISRGIQTWYNIFKELGDVQDEFSKGLDMINRFIDTGNLRPVHSSASKTQLIAQITSFEEKKLPRGIPLHKLHVSFRDCVDEYCSQNGLLCASLKADFSNAQSMFKISRSSDDKGLVGYINQDVLFIKTGEQFEPISLDTLAERL
jgi:tuftelin-interacting protein 11